jgi:outer membrane protein assembly factor BamD
MRLILVSLVILIFYSCSSNNNDDFELYENIYENNKLQDFEIFERANSLIDNNNLDLALTELDKLEIIYPNSIYTRKAILLTAYIYFLKKEYEKTRAICETFKNYYPGSKDIIYANYLEAMTYYILTKKSDYSQIESKIALDKLNFILNAYPNSKYEIDVITKINVIKNNQASQKISIAKFYLEKNNVNGSLIYLKDIFENHNSSPYIEETLYLLTKNYIYLNELEIAKYYASILAYNFPNSSWYQKSYNLINNKSEIEDKKNWFQKLNPIKIIIDEIKTENGIEKIE